MKGKIYYYTDELRDDFAGTNIQQKQLPDDYEYLPKGKIRKVAAWFLFYVIVIPIAFICTKFASSQKIVGREKLKPYRKTGYYLYGNHTRTMGDAFTPSLISYPKKSYIVVNPDALSIPFLRRIVEDLGGIPVPQTLAHSRNFCRALDERAKLGNVIVIYPEAHIWPKYVGIRNFPATSFTYPVKTGKPCFTFTTTYQKRKIFGGVKTTVFVDGPFFPDPTLPVSERKTALRNVVYQSMVDNSRHSTFSPNSFIKK